MKYRLKNFPLIHLLLLYFILLLSEKSIFYSKNMQYAYNFYGKDLHVNVCRGVFRTQSNIHGGPSLQKSQESFIVDVCFTVEKVYRMSIFI